MTDNLMRGAVVGMALGLAGQILVMILMLRRRANERRERESTRPVKRATDPHDWHGAPVSKPR